MSSTFHVCYWQIVRDRPLPDGRMLCAEPMTPRFATPDQAAQFLKGVRRSCPSAYRVRFDIETPDPATLAAVRDEIVSPQASAAYHAGRATRLLAIVGRHKPGRRRRRLLVEATRQRRLASEALEGRGDA